MRIKLIKTNTINFIVFVLYTKDYNFKLRLREIKKCLN